jgi:hypothetical protein
MPCRRAPSTQAGEEALLFEPDADLRTVKEILEAYQSAKGS